MSLFLKVDPVEAVALVGDFEERNLEIIVHVRDPDEVRAETRKSLDLIGIEKFVTVLIHPHRPARDRDDLLNARRIPRGQGGDDFLRVPALVFDVHPGNALLGRVVDEIRVVVADDREVQVGQTFLVGRRRGDLRVETGENRHRKHARGHRVDDLRPIHAGGGRDGSLVNRRGRVARQSGGLRGRRIGGDRWFRLLRWSRRLLGAGWQEIKIRGDRNGVQTGTGIGVRLPDEHRGFSELFSRPRSKSPPGPFVGRPVEEPLQLALFSVGGSGFQADAVATRPTPDHESITFGGQFHGHQGAVVAVLYDERSAGSARIRCNPGSSGERSSFSFKNGWFGTVAKRRTHDQDQRRSETRNLGGVGKTHCSASSSAAPARVGSNSASGAKITASSPAISMGSLPRMITISAPSCSTE